MPKKVRRISRKVVRSVVRIPEGRIDPRFVVIVALTRLCFNRFRPRPSARLNLFVASESITAFPLICIYPGLILFALNRGKLLSEVLSEVLSKKAAGFYAAAASQIIAFIAFIS